MALLSQVAESREWKTTLLLANIGTTPSRFDLRFRNPDGNLMSFPLGMSVFSELSLDIPARGLRIVESPNNSPGLIQGWAEVTGPASSGGTAIFRQRLPGLPDSEAAVPLVFENSSRVFLPFDNRLGFSTSVAIVNTDVLAGTEVRATYRDENGRVITTELIPLLAGGQRAFDSFASAPNRRGLAEFASSSGRIAGLGLRFSPNRTFTSIQMAAPPPVAVPTVRQIAAHVADGGGWRTTIMLGNTGSSPASFDLRLRDRNGLPLRFSFAPEGRVTGVIEGGGARFFQTDDIRPDLSVGSAELLGPNSLTGTIIFRHHVPGRTDSEAAVPFVTATAVGRPFVIPFDNTFGFVTSVAVVNPDPVQSAIVTLIVRDEQGNELGRPTLPLNPLQHSSFESTRYDATLNRRGTIEFTGGPVELFGVGFRFNPPPTSTFTSLPVIPVR
jgi:hypothetical protein